MTYTKKTWDANTYITGNALNHLETQYDQLYTDYMYGHTHDTRYYPKAEADTTFFWASFMGLGSGSDADTLQTHHVGDVTANTFPVGSIILWTQALGTIPSGWALCNGSSGTIDLRNRFPVCAGVTLSPSTNVGSTSVTPSAATVTIDGHTLTTTELPSHTHSYDDIYGDSDIAAVDYGTAAAHAYLGDHADRSTNTDGGTGGAHDHSTGSSVTYASESNIPPYYAAYYIQRLT